MADDGGIYTFSKKTTGRILRSFKMLRSPRAKPRELTKRQQSYEDKRDTLIVPISLLDISRKQKIRDQIPLTPVLKRSIHNL